MRTKNTFRLIAFGLASLMVLGVSFAGATDFPLREEYPQLTPISTDELAKIYDKAIIIDARNHVEYNVIHIKNAKNILVGKMKKADLLKLRGLDDSRPIVFYCNGTTCSKSYKATRKAVLWGFKNVFVYDAGIFEWANTHPEKTEFFGEPMTAETAQHQLIKPEKYKEHCLSPREFLAKVKEGTYTLFDIRDRKERNEIPMRLPGTKKVTLDEFVTFLKNEGAIPTSHLLFFGNVGKQTRWLQYYLEKYGRQDYYFLDGGVKRWVEEGFNPEGVLLSTTGE